MALQFAPPLLLVSVTGWVADRFDRRKLLILTQGVLLLLAVALGAMILTGHMTLPIMYGFALALGDRKSVAEGKRVSVSVDLGGRGSIKKQTNHHPLTYI